MTTLQKLALKRLKELMAGQEDLNIIVPDCKAASKEDQYVLWRSVVSEAKHYAMVNEGKREEAQDWLDALLEEDS